MVLFLEFLSKDFLLFGIEHNRPLSRNVGIDDCYKNRLRADNCKRVDWVHHTMKSSIQKAEINNESERKRKRKIKIYILSSVFDF